MIENSTNALFATYNLVTPPDISPDFFNKKVEYKLTNFNPISNIYNQLMNIQTIDEQEDLIVNENEKEIKKKKIKKKAKKIVEDTPEITTTSFKSNQEFTKVMNTLYKSELSKRGLDTSLSVMLTAQDAIETGWGKSVKGKFNMGNITTNGNDWTKKTGNRKWKDFKSLNDYVSYKIDFLSNKRYLFFTYATSSNVLASMQRLANLGYDPGNPKYGLLVSQVYNTVQKYLNNV